MGMTSSGSFNDDAADAAATAAARGDGDGDKKETVKGGTGDGTVRQRKPKLKASLD